ncbi:V-set and immunoglobulin domain-containing protein 4 isoform X2 [Ascaphus truei]|uniref:V-set and immunoglobulin domain-containing protein 4 isoform X2 n=1 Tax=Ascaphus truei TaxID=8439 RepID=UPI003F5A7256
MAEMEWLILSLMILRGGNALGAADLSLDVPHTVSGVRRGSVVIPCTYSPSSEYTQSEVSWYYSSSLFFHRYDSEDHVVLTRYRDRVTVSNSRPGDVSLTLSNLEIMDRGRFMCKVKWRAKTDGTRVTKEGSISLNVLRENPVTQKPDVEVTTSTSTIKTRTSQNAAVPTVRKSGAMKSSQPTQETSNKQHRTGAESTLSTHTTAHHARPDGLGAAADPGVPHYILILIGVIFALSVLTLALVLVTRRKRKRDQSYGVPTMRQLAVMLDGAPVSSGGCQPCASQSPRAENIYQPCKEQPENEYQPCKEQPENEYQPCKEQPENEYQPCKEQPENEYQPCKEQPENEYQPCKEQPENEYQPCKEQPENEYQPLKAWDDNEYELLVPERGGSI